MLAVSVGMPRPSSRWGVHASAAAWLLGCAPPVAAPVSANGAGSSSTTSDGGSTGASASGMDPARTTAHDMGAVEGSSSGGAVPACGNGWLEDGEVCDDGNAEDGDGCNADCMPGGLEIWTRTFDAGQDLDDYGHRVAIDAEDHVYVVGTAHEPGPTATNGLILEYDEDGRLQWSDVFDNRLPNDSVDGFFGVAIAPDRSVVVTGRTTIDHDVRQPLVRMYSSDGEVLWTYVEPDVDDSYAFDVVVDSSGAVVVTGVVHDPVDRSPRAWLAKLSRTGEPLWNLRLQLPTSYGNGLLAVDSTDALVVAGADGMLAHVTKLDADGGTRWSWIDSRMGLGAFMAVATGPADEIVVAGELHGNAYLARHPAAGVEPTWTFVDGGPRGHAYASTIACDHTGRVLFAGPSYDPTISENHMVFVRKLDESGAPIWTHEIEAEVNGFDVPNGLAVDSLARPVIVGAQYGAPGDYDVFVRKLTP